MPIQHHAIWEGRDLTVTWLPAPFQPPRDSTTQVMGVCFADDQIVLVSPDHAYWTLPGGKPEPGETVLDALRREVHEEACAIVRQAVYLGAQRIEDPSHPDGPQVYYQSRFWASVALLPFAPAFETIARRLVAPGDLLSTLSWGDSSIAPVLLELALNAEKTFRHAPREG